MSTIAEKLINEGKKEGEKEGEKKGFLNAKVETALNLLTKKFGVLPENISSKISKADSETLNLILDNIFDLTSLEDIDNCLQSYTANNC